MSDSEIFIKFPDKMEYRGNEYYDLEDDICSEECAKLFETYSDIKKRYSDVTKIAEGGMKKIYRAYDKKSGRYISIAKLKDGDEKFHGTFLAEARMTSALQHPNIIQVHEIDFDENKQPYFTMDLKVGDSLLTIIENIAIKDECYLQNYSREELIELFLKVCDAVSYSHSQGILHLDIKPDNIQVGDYGEVLLCDWGMARYTGDYHEEEDTILNTGDLLGATLQGEIRGTPGFMAPELIIDKSNRCEQTDIYALGALLYTLLTFQRPLDGSVENILENTAKGNIISPQNKMPELNIPDSLDSVVLKAMSLQIEDRYQTVNELMTDVRKYIFGFSTEAEEADFIKEAELFIKRNRKVCTISFISLLLIAIIVTVFITHLHHSREQEVELRKKAQLAEAEAVENLKRYEEEKQLANASLTFNPKGALSDIKEKFNRNFLFDPIGSVETVMQKLKRIKEVNSEDAHLHEIKADMHFIKQEFQLALVELKKGRGDKISKTKIKALEMITDYHGEGKASPISVLKKILTVYGVKMGHMHIRMLFYDRMYRNNLEQHLEFIKEVFKAANRIDKLDEFNYHNKSKTLTIKGEFDTLGKYFDIYDRRLSFFSSIEIDHLKLSSSLKLKVHTLQGLKLKSLDLRSMKFRKGEFNLPEGITEKVIFTKGFVAPSVIKSLREHTYVEFD